MRAGDYDSDDDAGGADAAAAAAAQAAYDRDRAARREGRPVLADVPPAYEIDNTDAEQVRTPHQAVYPCVSTLRVR